jgi:hypothetical protein
MTLRRCAPVPRESRSRPSVANGVCQDSIIAIAAGKSAATEKIPERMVLNRGPASDALPPVRNS